MLRNIFYEFAATYFGCLLSDRNE